MPVGCVSFRCGQLQAVFWCGAGQGGCLLVVDSGGGAWFGRARWAVDPGLFPVRRVMGLGAGTQGGRRILWAREAGRVLVLRARKARYVLRCG